MIRNTNNAIFQLGREEDKVIWSHSRVQYVSGINYQPSSEKIMKTNNDNIIDCSLSALSARIGYIMP